MGRSENILRAVDILYLLMLQYKVNFYSQDFKTANFSKQTLLTSTGLALNPAAAALDLYTSFALPSNKNYSWNAYLSDPKSSLKEVETFAKGKTAMIFGYSYLYEQIQNAIKDLKDRGVPTIDAGSVKIAPVPQITDSTTSADKKVAYANYFAETVSRTSDHPNEAWDFLMYLTSAENLKIYGKSTHRPTSRRDLINEQLLDPVYGVFAQQIGFAESLPIYDAQKYNDILSTAIDQVLATLSPSEAIRGAESSINKILPDSGWVPKVLKTNTNAAITTAQQKPN